MPVCRLLLLSEGVEVEKHKAQKQVLDIKMKNRESIINIRPTT